TSSAPRAIVTGAAGGLGRACAVALAADGYALTLIDRDEVGLRATGDQLAATRRTDGEVETLALDLLDESAVPSALGDPRRLATVRALVNCAGLVGFGPITSRTLADWDQMLGVKLRGDFLMCKAVIPALIAAGGGAIVNIGSMSGRTKSVTTSPDYVVS